MLKKVSKIEFVEKRKVKITTDRRFGTPEKKTALHRNPSPNDNIFVWSNTRAWIVRYVTAVSAVFSHSLGLTTRSADC